MSNMAVGVAGGVVGGAVPLVGRLFKPAKDRVPGTVTALLPTLSLMADPEEVTQDTLYIQNTSVHDILRVFKHYTTCTHTHTSSLSCVAGSTAAWRGGDTQEQRQVKEEETVCFSSRVQCCSHLPLNEDQLH